jgi:hypothetical protein
MLLPRKEVTITATRFMAPHFEAAARFGHLEIAKILLAAGVNVDKQGSKQSDEQKSTESSCVFGAALSIEDRTRMKEMVRLLIDAGARVDYILAPNATYPYDNALYRVCGGRRSLRNDFGCRG